MTLDSPSTKRRRVSSSPKPVVIISSGEDSPPLASGQEKFTRHVDFWLDDGNLILLAGDTAFRIYQGLLTKKCVVFANMFATGSVDATEAFDGSACPVVRLTDHPEDLADFLQYLMPCAKLTLQDGLPVSDFDELHAAIHLAHKYQCPDVDIRALAILKRFHTTRFADYYPFDEAKFALVCPTVDAAIAAVNIAHLTDTPSMLPLALYRVCMLEGAVMDGYERRDGSVEHLSAEDLRSCIDARAELAVHNAGFIKTVFALEPCDDCKAVSKCTAALKEMLKRVEAMTVGSCAVL